MRMTRRTLLGVGLAAAAGAAGGCSGPGAPPRPTASPAGPSGSSRATAPTRPPGVRPTTPAELIFTTGRTLTAAPTPAPYRSALIDTISRYLKPTPANPLHPGFSGAVVLTAIDGVATVHEAIGDALRYGAGPVELPAAQRVPMRPDSIFDLASITKVFTTLLVLRQIDRGLIDVDAPVGDYLSEYRSGGKGAVTISMLLSHISGLPVGVSMSSLSGLSSPAQRAKILSTPLLPGVVPGALFRYSSTDMMVLGLLLERLTGRSLDVLCRSELTDPLGLSDTIFTPLRWLSTAARIRLVATDARSSRGVVRGEVHDGAAYSLGGVAGHAGLFSTARDLAVLGQMLVNGGEYAGVRILREGTVRAMLVNVNIGLPATDPDRPHRTSTHGLGVELNQTWFMGKLAAPLTFGHTGFTGTCLIVDPVRRLVLVLLTNRAHPNWTWANPDPPRVAVSNVVAAAVPGP